MAMRTTFSRNGAGWAFGANHELNQFATDVERVEFDLRTGVYMGILIEEERTRLLSPEMLNYYSGYSADAGIGLDGSYSAGRLTASSGDPAASTSTGPLSDSGDYVYYIYVKSAASPGQYVHQARVSGGPQYTKLFQLTTSEWTPAALVVPGLVAGDSILVYPIDDRQSNNTVNDIYFDALGVERGTLPLSPIPMGSQTATRAADFFDAPGALNEYGSGLHTWRNAVRMSRDPGEPTIISSAEHRIYASNGRLHLDGPGELIQPEGEHAPGDYVPFVWNVQFPGAAPDFALGREYGDANWWNGHLVDIVPFPRKLTAAEINAWVGV